MTNVKNEEPKCLLEPKQLFMIFVGLFIISVISYFVIKTPWIIIVTNHLGALGLTGLFAILAAKLATRKNYSFAKAFRLSVLVPILLGVLAVLLFYFLRGFIYCGGGVMLLASLIFIVVYALIRDKKKDEVN